MSEPDEAVGTYDDVAGEMEKIVSLFCPFCLPAKRLVHAGILSGSPALVHELPYCKEFDDLEPDEFLHRARVRYSG
jgi:hypothetical protein